MRTVVDIYSFELAKPDNTRVSSKFGVFALGKTQEKSIVEINCQVILCVSLMLGFEWITYVTY